MKTISEREILDRSRFPTARKKTSCPYKKTSAEFKEILVFLDPLLYILDMGVLWVWDVKNMSILAGPFSHQKSAMGHWLI